jgi:hypothetical protein
MIVDGTKYGTDHERYCISGIVKLGDLAEHPHPVPNYHLSPEYAREKTAIQHRLGEEEWKPTLKRNRLTAGLTSSGWMGIVRRDNVQLEDGRHYPMLEIPNDVHVKIEEGAALLAVLRSSVGDGSRLPSSTGLGVKWCVVDFLLWGKQGLAACIVGTKLCVQTWHAMNTRQHRVSIQRSVLS